MPKQKTYTRKPFKRNLRSGTVSFSENDVKEIQTSVHDNSDFKVIIQVKDRLTNEIHVKKAVKALDLLTNLEPHDIEKSRSNKRYYVYYHGKHIETR